MTQGIRLNLQIEGDDGFVGSHIRQILPDIFSKPWIYYMPQITMLTHFWGDSFRENFWSTRCLLSVRPPEVHWKEPIDLLERAISIAAE